MKDQTATDPIKIYDARWELDDFTPLEIRRFVDAVLLYGRSLDIDTVTIARDARLGAGAVMEMTVEAAVAAGFTVYLCTDPISTPQSYFFSSLISEKHSHTMGLTITASHNPANYVGLKVVVPEVQAIGLNCGPGGGFSKIGEIYHGDDSLKIKRGGRLNIVNPTERYVRFSLKAAGIEKGDLKGMKVVLDGMNGSAGPEMYTALHRAGVSVLPLRLVPDGTFPSGSPNPTSRNKMDEAVQLAGQTGAVVFGTDGDGDRLVFGDGRGIWDAGFVSIPILGNLLKADFRSETAPAESTNIIYDPKVNPVALVKWAGLGVKPVLFGNGHSQIKEHMRRINALAAFEESGHYYHRINTDDSTIFAENSVLTMLLFLKSLNKHSELAQELWDWQNSLFTTGEINYQFTDDAICDRVLTDIRQFFKQDGAALMTESAEGIDLLGTVFRKGVNLREGRLGNEWYSGYLRLATNEKSVIRFFLSAAGPSVGQIIEQKVRMIFERYSGTIIE